LVPEVPQGNVIVIAARKIPIDFVIVITFFLRRLSQDESPRDVQSFALHIDAAQSITNASCHF
jgi:hypothetical protein